MKIVYDKMKNYIATRRSLRYFTGEYCSFNHLFVNSLLLNYILKYKINGVLLITPINTT